MIADAPQNTQTILEYFLASALAAKKERKKEKKAACLILLFLHSSIIFPRNCTFSFIPKNNTAPLPLPQSKNSINIHELRTQKRK